jgi:hypothetical protein
MYEPHPKCSDCGDPFRRARAVLGYKRCIACQEIEDREHPIKRCIVPMHKSNLVVITNLDDLRGINNKGGLVK